MNVAAKKSAAKRKAPSKGTWPPAEVWIVFVDHSALGIWLSEGDAMKAVNMRRRDSLLEVAYQIRGYRSMGGGR